MGFDAANYLGTVLPAVIASREAPGPLPSATIQFLVRDGAQAELSYRLDPETGLTVATGVSDRQDLTLVIVEADLEALSKGTLDVDAALKSRRLVVHGDPNLLAWLAGHLAH